MDSINEMLQFLDENARLDLKAVAVTHVLCRFLMNFYILNVFFKVMKNIIIQH